MSNSIKKVLVIDNYDSFTYNLVHYLKDLNVEVDVKRNDKLTLKDVEPYNLLLLSPGPGLPKDAGLLMEIIKKYAPTKKILGVCLGQQAIAEVFGGELRNLEQVHHGVSSKITQLNNDDVLYKDIPKVLEVGRYHSWVVAEKVPDCLEVTSVDENGEIMSLKHKTYDVRGVQYHPESILTPLGKQLLKNWINS